MSEKRCYSNLHRERISYSEKAFAWVCQFAFLVREYETFSVK